MTGTLALNCDLFLFCFVYLGRDGRKGPPGSSLAGGKGRGESSWLNVMWMDVLSRAKQHRVTAELDIVWCGHVFSIISFFLATESLGILGEADGV